MGKVKIPGPVKIIAGLIFHKHEIFDKAFYSLSKIFGSVELVSGLLPFRHTAYYNDEMDEGLKRKLLGFKELRSIEELHKLKIATNRLEKRFSVSGRRRVNIDPGYLDPGKVVLLTTKDYSHRIYLKRGIYAEVTLFFKDKTFQPWSWTYPDYKTKEYIDFFNRLRGIYLKELKNR